jgi:glycosyltransferase involved in cell wall biosynthesis
MNVQSWSGCEDPKFGYGSMLHGFRDAAPNTITFSPFASVNVYMGVPYDCRGWAEGQHRVLFTMWETDTLPTQFTNWLSQFDQILVPCEHNVELFSRYHSDVKMVPLGVDYKFWSATDYLPSTTFRFHAGGSLWHRKGLDLVVKAFKMLNLKDAELHIKAAPHARDTPSKSLGENIYLNRQWMAADQQRDWYRQAHCYVAPTRGEGWGLMPLQAISSGIPTIMSDSTGQQEFLHLATGVVPCGKSPAETVGKWDEPDVKILAEQMLYHYENRDLVKTQAMLNAKSVKDFSWAKATSKLLKAIPVGEMLATSTLTVMPNVSVAIQVCRKVNASIGNQQWQLKPGETYIVPENVYEVLYNSGALIK